MAGEYITIPLNTSLKGWNARWFYMKQSHPAIHCDVDHVPENQRSWSKRASSANMEPVKELLGLIKGMKMNGGLVAASFIVRRIQPCKERAHAGFDFKGDTNGTRERMERLMKEAVPHRATELFTPNTPYSVPG